MITLINPPGVKATSALQMHFPNPPLGLAYIAAAVKESGRRYCVIDSTGEALDEICPHPLRDDLILQGLSTKETVARIPKDTKVVGIGCMFSSTWSVTRELAEHVRESFPDVLIVMGGEHVTALADYVLQDSPADVLVLGEGEETFITLLDALDNNQPIYDLPGIAAYKDGNRVINGIAPRTKNIDAIPYPDWGSFPIEEYISRNQTNGINLGRSMPLLTTRGCPYQCTFCSNANMWTTRYIPRDPKHVVDEMEAYVEKYKVSNFNSQDLTAIVKRRWALDFCNELIERDLNITWQMPTGTRSEVFDEEVVDLLYRSGCRLLSFAPESGSPKILEDMKKQIDLEKLFKSIRSSLSCGFKVSCFIVIGFPTETRADLKMTMRLIRKLAVIGVHDITVSKFVPYPGSPVFQDLLSKGKVQLSDEFFLSPMDLYSDSSESFTDDLTAKTLYWTMISMFSNFYILSFIIRPLRVIMVLWKAVTTGVEETKYAKWFVYWFYTRPRWRRSLSSGSIQKK